VFEVRAYTVIDSSASQGHANGWSTAGWTDEVILFIAFGLWSEWFVVVNADGRRLALVRGRVTNPLTPFHGVARSSRPRTGRPRDLPQFSRDLLQQLVFMSSTEAICTRLPPRPRYITKVTRQTAMDRPFLWRVVDQSRRLGLRACESRLCSTHLTSCCRNHVRAQLYFLYICLIDVHGVR